MNSYQTPSGWSDGTVGETCVLQTGGTPSRKKPEYWNGDIPWIKTGEVDYKLITQTEEHISADGLKNSNAKLLPIGTLLMAMYGQGITRGKVAITGLEAATNQACAAITPRDQEQLTTDFLYWFLTYQYEELRSRGHGANQRNLSMTLIKIFEIAYPPLPEQKTIAHILSTVHRAIEAQERIIQTTTELKKVLMHQLFTEGLRNEPQKQTEFGPVPKSWEVVPLEEIAESFQYGTSVKCGYDVVGKAVLRIPNVVGGAVDISDLKFGNPKANEIDKLKLQSGDLLFVRTNGVKENAGRCSLFEDEIDDCYYASYLIRVRLDPSALNSTFLNEYSRTEVGTSFLSGKAIRTADGKFNINSGTLKTMLVPLPSIDEQNEIAKSLALIDTKSSGARTKKSAYEDLFHTLLHELMTAKTRVHEFDFSRTTTNMENAL